MKTKHEIIKEQKARRNKPEPKPDPVALGEELAEYVNERRIEFERRIVSGRVAGGVTDLCNDSDIYHVLILRWERDFWRDKALNP